MNYELLSYRKLIKEVVEEKKKQGIEISFQKIAEKMRVQKSYLSKVINNQADLSGDQLYLLSKILAFSEDEKYFINLLWEYERTALSERKNEIFDKIKIVQEKKKEISSNINANQLKTETFFEQEYYLDPYLQLVHIFFSIEEFQKTPGKIKKILNLSSERFREIINKLVMLKIISKEKNGHYKNRITGLHLPKNSPFFSSWLRSVRLNSLAQNLTSSQNDNYNFSVIFSADHKTQETINKEFLIFISKMQSLVKEAESKHVYQVNFDFLKWG